MRRETRPPKKHSVLCSKHFPADAFHHKKYGDKMQKLLIPGVVPSIFGIEKICEHQGHLLLIENDSLIDESNKMGHSHKNPITDISDSTLSIPPALNFEGNVENTTSIEVAISSHAPIKGNTLSSADIRVTPNFEKSNAELESKHHRFAFPKPHKRKIQSSICQVKVPKRSRQANPAYPRDCVLKELRSVDQAKKSLNVLTSYITGIRKKLKTTMQRNRRLEARVKTMKGLIDELKKNNLVSPDAAQLLTTSVTGPAKSIFERLVSAKKKQPFSQELKTFATTLQFHSNRAYNYVRNTFMRSLPHQETIRKWFQSVDGKPGISREAILSVRNKVAEATEKGKKMHFSPMVDEMSIKHQVEWGGKEYHGFVDIETELDDDELPEASYALVFMIVNINGHFKIPVAYYLINGMTAIERGNLLNESLIALYEATIHIVSVTFDGAPTNISMVNHLGANIRPHGMINYFSHPITR